MRLWELEAALGSVAPFARPKTALEQYVTSPHLAARLLRLAEESFGDIRARSVLDLGCGTGTLSFGASALGASSVVGLDVDREALEIAKCNQEVFKEDVDPEAVEVIFVETDLRNGLPFARRENDLFDTVVTNPPFGTKAWPGADLLFVRLALEVAPVAYSLHKTSTRKHLLKHARERGVDGDVVAELRFDLPRTMKFHKRESVDIAVDLIRFTRSEPSSGK